MESQKINDIDISEKFQRNLISLKNRCLCCTLTCPCCQRLCDVEHWQNENITPGNKDN